VIPWVQLDVTKIPGGAETLRLMQRGTEFSIMLGTNELMNSRLSGSEEALADLACGPFRNSHGARVLIGGLGMGFTLRAALSVLPEDAAVVVGEIVPQIVKWARGPLAPVFRDCLHDLRVCIKEADVAQLIVAAAQHYDVILLDVDNGPDGLVRSANDRLYSVAGLRAAHAALKPGGVLAVWSAHPSEEFTRRLGRSGLLVAERQVRASSSGKGRRHTIWIATKPG